MNSRIKDAYLTAIFVALPACGLGAIVAAIGSANNWKIVTALGGLLTLPLTALLGIPCLAIVAFGPIAILAAIGADSETGWPGKLLSLVGVLAGAAWAGFVLLGVCGMAFGK